MKAIGSNIYLNSKETATVLGLSEVALEKMVLRGDSHWKGIKDPDDGRMLLISLADMKPKYRMMIEAHYGDMGQILYTIEREQMLAGLRLRMERKLLGLPERDYGYLTGWRSASGMALPDVDFSGYQMACRWLHSLNTWQETGRDWYRFVLGAQTARSVWDGAIEIIKHKELPLPGNYSRLTMKVNEYRRAGAEAVLARAWRYGNSNAQKLEEQHKQTLLALMCDELGRKFTYPQVHAQFIALAREQGWMGLLQPKPISLSAVKSFLERPENKNVWYLHRYGSKAWSDRNELVIPQERSSEPHLQWQIDGFQQNLWYWDGKTIRKLYTIRIIDSYSHAIVGWSVGFNENTQLVFEAIKMACMVHGVVPTELKSDNSSAMKAAETKQLFEALGIRVVNTQPYKGRSKKIEPHSVWLKQQIEEYYVNVSGGNITAKTLNTRNNPDKLKANAKSFPDSNGLVNQINQLHARWNMHTTSTPLPPEGGFKSNPFALLAHDAPRLRVLTLEMRMQCFYVFRRKGANLLTYACTNRGVVVTLPSGDKVTYHPVLVTPPTSQTSPNPTPLPPEGGFKKGGGFSSGGGELQTISAWMNENIGRSFAVKYDRTDTDTIGLYSKDGSQFICYATVAERVSEVVADLKTGDGVRLQRLLQEQKAQKQQAMDKGKAALEYVRANQILEGGISFERVYKDTALAAEEELDRLFGLGYLQTELATPLPPKGELRGVVCGDTDNGGDEDEEDDDVYASLGAAAMKDTKYLRAAATEED